MGLCEGAPRQQTWRAVTVTALTRSRTTHGTARHGSAAAAAQARRGHVWCLAHVSALRRTQSLQFEKLARQEIRAPCLFCARA
eukprot:6197020-Pleurochrysis_carterae.AAC.5